MSVSGQEPAGHDTPRGVIEGPHRKTRRETCQAALFLLAALVVFLWPAIWGGRVLLPADLIFDVDPLWRPLAPPGFTHPANPILADQVDMYFPWQVLITTALDQGYVPLWNPFIKGGLPFVGNGQTAVFGPFSLIGYLFPMYAKYAVTAVLRLFVAGISTFLFAREIGLSKTGALLAMTAFTFSGPMIVWLGYTLSPVIVWLPLMLLTIERMVTRKRWSYVAAGGLVMGAQFLGGHPETSFHVMSVGAAYALYRAVALEGWRLLRLLPHVLRVAAAGGAGVLLAAVQFFPFLEALGYSSTFAFKGAQAAPWTAGRVLQVFFDWREWPSAITALLPNYFGTDLDGSYWFPYSNYVELDTYVGVLPLALALAAALPARWRSRSPRRSLILFLGGTGAVCLGLALHLPLLNAINQLPFLEMLASERLRLVYAFAVAILAGAGLDEMAKHEPARRILARLLVLMAIASLILIGAAYGGLVVFRDSVIRSGREFIQANWGTPYLSRPLEYYDALVQERYEKKLALFRPGNWTMYLPVLTALAWLALLRWQRGRPQVLAYGVLGLTVVDAFAVWAPFNPTLAPEHVFPTPGAIQFLRQDQDVYRVVGTDLILYPNSGMVFGLADVRGYEPVVLQRYNNLVDRIEGRYRYHFHLLFVSVDSPLLDLLNVKYALTDRELSGKWELVYQDAGSVRVYRNRQVQPRAFVVYRALVVSGAERSLESVTQDGFDFRGTAVLEARPSGWVEPLDAPAIPAAVQIVDYEPNRVRLRVETSADGLLLLTDTYMPGWVARVDGRQTPVYVADHAFRAVVVPAGAHGVEFEYSPLSFSVGAAASLLTLAGLVFALLVPRWKRTRGRSR